jgi:hypothetical protein
MQAPLKHMEFRNRPNLKLGRLQIVVNRGLLAVDDWRKSSHCAKRAAIKPVARPISQALASKPQNHGQPLIKGGFPSQVSLR